MCYASTQTHFNGDLLPGKLLRGKITTMCAVYNTVWMGTSIGDIRVYHATLITSATPNVVEGQTNVYSILDMVHIEERGTVILSNFIGQVWCYDDVLSEDGLRLQCTIELDNGLPCYQLTKVGKLVPCIVKFMSYLSLVG